MSDPPAVPLTTLQAVNELLRAVSLREVASTSATTDSFNAYRCVSRASASVQAKGWFCNTEEGLSFVRNAGPTPPLNTVSINQSLYLIVRPNRGGNVWPTYLTVRSGLLYDLTNHTNVFSVDPELDVVQALDFSDLPTALRWYITCEAGLQFLPATYPTPENYTFTQGLRDQASADAAHEDEILRDSALYETSPHFRSMRQR